ncbi:DUF4433 domain-containing protein [Mycolicibacterium cosmeticum]|uniref:DUF4433 domain-containing protein n=1 Tax=Mycolicibacterium cosmeticum TaxID=258533 RepID=UPI00320473AC
MDRNRVQELHYITPLDNLASIVQHGLVSHTRAARVQHTSIANESVQDRRADRQVPGGLQLHDYVNLYFDARNSMMYDRRGMRANMVVLRISHSVLDIPGVVIADGNAASSGTKFAASPAGLAGLDPERVYAHSWDHPDPWIKRERKRQRSAEVLVPHRIGPEHIVGGYVHIADGIDRCNIVSADLAVEVNAYVFFFG